MGTYDKDILNSFTHEFTIFSMKFHFMRQLFSYYLKYYSLFNAT